MVGNSFADFYASDVESSERHAGESLLTTSPFDKQMRQRCWVESCLSNIPRVACIMRLPTLTGESSEKCRQLWRAADLKSPLLGKSFLLRPDGHDCATGDIRNLVSWIEGIVVVVVVVEKI